MTEKALTDLERVQRLFDFLQGKIPKGVQVDDEANRMPRLTPDQAWVAVWFVQEVAEEIKDTIDRCDVCGELYDSTREGGYKEDGPPYHFCDSCYDVAALDKGE